MCRSKASPVRGSVNSRWKKTEKANSSGSSKTTAVPASGLGEDAPAQLPQGVVHTLLTTLQEETDHRA